jgi:isochorismate hydrolase
LNSRIRYLNISKKERHDMVELENKKLPTPEQVEWIITDWNNYTLDEFSESLGLEKAVVEETVRYLRRLKRGTDESQIPAVACYREDNLKSIVRCAGAKHGYIME